MAQPGYEKMSGKFLQYYNAQLPDSLFALYSQDLKNKLPPGKTSGIISGLHIQFGDLKSLQLLETADGFNIYKATFAHQTKCLLIELSTDGLLNGYRLTPYNPAQYPDHQKIPSARSQ